MTRYYIFIGFMSRRCNFFIHLSSHNSYSVNIDSKKLVYALYYPLLLLLLLWLTKLFEITQGVDLYTYGNYPLDPSHLTGIFTQPFIHENFAHLWSNSIPLLFLVWALFYFYGDISFRVFMIVWVLSGLVTWFIGRPSYHIGASGMVYGFAFFLFFSGILRRMRSLMAISAIVAFLYGSMVWSMLPIVQIWEPTVSWEGHLSGAISGLVCAIWFRKSPPYPPVEIPETEEPSSEDDSPQYWLDPVESEEESKSNQS